MTWIFIFSSLLWAQDEINIEDHYDPFSDYSEFAEASEEEADLNFFKNGRMLSAHLIAGQRTFIGHFKDYYSDAPIFGIYLTYFFNLQLALQGGFMTSTHQMSFDIVGGTYDANVKLSNFSIQVKYFFNTQYIQRSLAYWNPHVILGVSQIFRNTSESGSVINSEDGALGFDFGVGFEYMFNDKRNFIGILAMYEYASFPGEGENFLDPSGVGETNQRRGGDPILAFLTIGTNF